MSGLIAKMDAVLMDGESATWNLPTFLEKLGTNMKTWIGYIITIIGLVMLIVGVYKGAKKLIQGQQGGQTSWITVILLVGIGATLCIFSLSNLIGFGLGFKDTVGALGGTS